MSNKGANFCNRASSADVRWKNGFLGYSAGMVTLLAWLQIDESDEAAFTLRRPQLRFRFACIATVPLGQDAAPEPPHHSFVWPYPERTWQWDEARQACHLQELARTLVKLFPKRALQGLPENPFSHDWLA